MKAAAYLRASHDPPDDRERQLEPIRRRAEVSGWELADIYADPSGRRGNRPSFQRLRAAAEQRTVDVIIIERLDCLAGSLRELAQLFEDLRRCQVSLVSLDEEIDTSTGHGDLVCHVMRAVGRFERRLHGERLRVGLARARALGTRVGRPPAGVEHAAVVRLRHQGLSYRQVGRQLGISATLAHRLARPSSSRAPGAV